MFILVRYPVRPSLEAPAVYVLKARSADEAAEHATMKIGSITGATFVSEAINAPGENGTMLRAWSQVGVNEHWILWFVEGKD